MVSEINEESYKYILLLRYRDAFEWRKIAVITNYSIQHVYKLRIDALNKFDAVYKKFAKDKSK